jgi:hypothetical protein
LVLCLFLMGRVFPSVKAVILRFEGIEGSSMFDGVSYILLPSLGHLLGLI